MQPVTDSSKWQHKKSGKVYNVICVTNLFATKPDFVQQVVYQDEEMVIWSRPLSEWEDKFSFIKEA